MNVLKGELLKKKMTWRRSIYRQTRKTTVTGRECLPLSLTALSHVLKKNKRGYLGGRNRVQKTVDVCLRGKEGMADNASKRNEG